MSRGSSNKVVEQQSSSSNTTAPIDTPSGTSLTHTHTHTHKGYNYTKVLLLCLRLQQPPNEKTEPGCSQDPEVPAPMPPQVRHKSLRTHRCAHIQGHAAIHITRTHLQPTATRALTTLVLIVGVVLLFL